MTLLENGLRQAREQTAPATTPLTPLGASLNDSRRWTRLVIGWLGLATLLFLGTIFLYTGNASDHRDLYYLFIFAPFLFFLFWRREVWQALLPSRIVLITLLLATLGVVSILYTPELGVSEFYDALRYSLLIVTFVFLLAVLRASYPRYLLWVAQGLIVFGTVAAIYFTTGYFIEEGGIQVGSRMHPDGGYVGNSIPFGQLMAVPILIATALALRAPRRLHVLLLVAAAVICLVPLLLTQSRAPLVALAVALVALLVYDRRWIATSLLSVVIAALAGVLLFAQSDYRDLTDATNIETRIYLYQETWAQSMDRPLLGHGWRAPDNIFLEQRDKLYGHPHNDYLVTLYRGGFVALAGFLALIGYALWIVLRQRDRPVEVLIALGLIIFYITTILFTKRWFYTNPNAAWIWFWLPLAMLIPYELEQRRLRWEERRGQSW